MSSNENVIEKASYPNLTRQLLSVRTLIDLEITKTIKQLDIFIIESDFCTTYSEVLSACIIYIILPVTVASA